MDQFDTLIKDLFKDVNIPKEYLTIVKLGLELEYIKALSVAISTKSPRKEEFLHELVKHYEFTFNSASEEDKIRIVQFIKESMKEQINRTMNGSVKVLPDDEFNKLVNNLNNLSI